MRETISEEYHVAQLPPLRRALPLLQRLLCSSGGRGAAGAEPRVFSLTPSPTLFLTVTLTLTLTLTLTRCGGAVGVLGISVGARSVH